MRCMAQREIDSAKTSSKMKNLKTEIDSAERVHKCKFKRWKSILAQRVKIAENSL